MDEDGKTLESPGGALGRVRVGPFRLLEVLGEGGMGVVLRAERDDGRPAAVKLVRALLSDPRARRRFEREASITIAHPNVVEVLGAGTADDGTPYIAFELLEGESLRERLSRGPLPPEHAVRVASEVCTALEAVHAAGIVHRDLKPGNVFCCADGRVKLLDFGVAHVANAHTQLTVSGSVVGTPAYLAPEQARGEHSVDVRADVWGVGTVLYESLSGTLPFDKPTALATMMAIVMESLPSLRARAPGVSSALAAVVERALSKDRAARYPSARELREALEGADLTPDAPDATAAVLPPGEQRVVAILLAEAVRDRLALTRAIEGRGGRPLPLAGGRAIGIFGGETWQGDELERAAEAALEARTAVQRVSVASGRASQTGELLSGEALREAERGCGVSIAGVGIATAAAHALTGRFDIRPRGDGWEIVGRRPSVNVEAMTVEELEGALYGRSVELAQLDLALRTVLDEGRAMAVSITGPPGIGKSRLRRELEALAARAGMPMTMLRSRGEPHRRDASLGLFARALRAHVLARAHDDEPLPVALTRIVLDAIPDARAEDHAAFLGELLGAALPETTTLRLARADPQVMRDRIRVAVRELVGGLLDERPVALVLEDLQWADLASLELVDELLEERADRPLLVLGTGRPELDERAPRLFATAEAIRLRPRPLRGNDVRALAERVAGRSLPAALIAALAERTLGNPLFLEQTVLSLLAEGGEPERLPLPFTVEAAVQTRLDHLPAPEKDFCKRASVLERAFEADEVAALGASTGPEVLTRLVRREVLARSGGRPVRYAFRSDLWAEVAYRMLPDEPRAELHRRAAAYLAHRADVDAEELARHLDRGGELDAAAVQYDVAAHAASRRGDLGLTLRCSARALELGVPPERRHALHMARADAFRFRGEREAQARELDAALADAGDAIERARALVEKVAWMNRVGRQTDAIEQGLDAIGAARGAGDPEVLALALARRAAACLYAGRVDEPERHLAEADGLRDRIGPRARAYVAAIRAELMGARGDVGGRIEAWRTAVAEYDAAGDERLAASMESNLADAYNRMGMYAEAESALAQALEKGHRLGYRLLEGYTSVNLAYSLTMQERHDEARARLDVADAMARSTNDARLALLTRVYRARVVLRAGDIAAEDAARTDALAREALAREQPAWAAIAHGIAAQMRLALGDDVGALASSTEAMALRERVGGVEEDEAELFLAHAEALERARRDDASAATLAAGRARLEAIAAGIADGAWRERFLRDVEAHRRLLGA